MERKITTLFVAGMALFWSFFSYSIFPVGGVDQSLVGRSSIIARSLLLALFGLLLAGCSRSLASRRRRILLLKGTLMGLCLTMLAASFSPASSPLGEEHFAIDAISALHIALLSFCWAWASDKVETPRLGQLFSLALAASLAIALLAKIISDVFPVSEPSISAVLPVLSSLCFLAIPAAPGPNLRSLPPAERLFDGSLGIMLITLLLYDLGSAVFRNGYLQGGIAYESIHETAGSWIICCAAALAVVGCVHYLERTGKMVRTAWLALALACLVSLYLIALFGSVLPAVCNDLVLSTRFLVIVATWVVIVASAHRWRISAVPLICALFLPFIAFSRLIIYGPWQFAQIGGDIPASFIFLATILAAALFITILVISHAIRQTRERPETISAGDDPAFEHAIEARMRNRYGLTQREFEIVELLSRGYSQKKIAELLVLSVGSVQSYSKAAYRKLGVHSKQEVIDLVAEERRN